MYSYILSLDAEENIMRIYEYGLGQFGLQQADLYYDMLFDCFDRIGRNPYLFPTADYIKVGYRYCVCGVDTIYYKISSLESVEIISIIGRQNYRV